MVLVLSEETDISTRDVIDWLCYTNKRFIRINDTDSIDFRGLKLTNENLEFKIFIGDKSISSSEIDSVWFRRGQFQFITNANIDFDCSPEVKTALFQFRNDESALLQLSVYRFIETVAKKKLDNIETAINRKLENLILAQKTGFNIPATAIVQTRNELISFYKEYGEAIITKSINERMDFDTSNGHVSFLSSLINEEDINCMPDEFFSSLIQERIPKKFDVRIFYLNNKIFSTAIITCPQYKDVVDYRSVKAIKDKLVRIVPFQLGQNDIDRLNIFMKALGRDTASFDFICTPDNSLFFLEVNPIGQFGFISHACNYYIERQIAQEL